MECIGQCLPLEVRATPVQLGVYATQTSAVVPSRATHQRQHGGLVSIATVKPESRVAIALVKWNIHFTVAVLFPRQQQVAIH